MAQKRKTAPPTRVSSRSSRNGRSGLIAKEKTEKQSVKRRTVLDNRFHRTSLVYRVDRAVARPAPHGSGRAGFPHPALRAMDLLRTVLDPSVNDARPRKRKAFRNPRKVFPGNRAPL